jgi:hypothetical protein
VKTFLLAPTPLRSAEPRHTAVVAPAAHSERGPSGLSAMALEPANARTPLSVIEVAVGPNTAAAAPGGPPLAPAGPAAATWRAAGSASPASADTVPSLWKMPLDLALVRASASAAEGGKAVGFYQRLGWVAALAGVHVSLAAGAETVLRVHGWEGRRKEGRPGERPEWVGPGSSCARIPGRLVRKWRWWMPGGWRPWW